MSTGSQIYSRLQVALFYSIYPQKMLEENVRLILSLKNWSIRFFMAYQPSEGYLKPE